MKFVERLNRDLVRNACIKNNFCTRMGNAEYSNMLMIAEREIANHKELIAAIEEMTSLIYSGTSVEGLTPEDIAGIIFRECVDRFCDYNARRGDGYYI